MNTDEKQKLLDAKDGLEVPNEIPANDQSSVQPLNVPVTPDLDIEEEVIDNGDYNWDDYDNYKIATDEVFDTRELSDIHEINKITRFYTKYLIEQKKPIKDREELEGLAKIMKHQKLFEEGKFTWEIALPDMDPIITLCKTTISKFFSPFDFEMLDHSLFQKLFPLKIIDQYLSIVNRVYGKPVYDKALRFQTQLLEIFLWHHLNADTRFHSKISTIDINVIDPFLRNLIRERNRNDKNLKEKYFNSYFDLKKFVYMLLDLYFPNVTWRYIGAGQEMHRWSLLLMLQIFELGFFRPEEMQELVNLLLQKLENLLVLEKRSYQDFKTTLAGYPKFIVTLKAYFYECKQIVAAICIHIAMLLNDQAFMDSYPLFNKELRVEDNPTKSNVWTRAYFSNASIGNILNRIMTTYLFQLTEPLRSDEREKMFALLNDFVMLTMDIENDVCYVSSKVVNQPLIEFYFSIPKKADEVEADRLSHVLENLVDQVSFLNLQRKKEYTENAVLAGLKNFLVALANFNEGSSKIHFKNLLGLRGVPNMLLSLLCGLINIEAKKEVEIICGLALTEVCKDSTINQVFATNENAMSHWQFIFKAKKLTGVILQTSIFEGNYHLFYVHRSTMKKFLTHFKNCIDPKWSLADVGCKTPEEWFTQFKAGVVDQEDDEQLDKLIIFYINCRFLSELVSNKDMNYESKFHNLEIQDFLAKPFFGLFFKIILDDQFLPKAENVDSFILEKVIEGGEPAKRPLKYNFRPPFKGCSAAQLSEFVERKSTNNISESELRCAVFEVAMLTMKLLNKACTGLYAYWIYKKYVKPDLPNLLEKTKYILELPNCPTEYRRIILNFYCNFRVFPNNSLMSFRTTEFPDPILTTRELRVLTNHKDGTLIKEIITELKHIKTIEAIWDDLPYERNNVVDYYYNGIIALLYKYFKGVYSCYSVDDKLDGFLKTIEQLRDEVQEISPILASKFKIHFDVSGSSQGVAETEGGLGGLLGGLNKILPSSRGTSTETGTGTDRIHDSDEHIYPNLAALRLLCEKFLHAMEKSIERADNQELLHLQEIIDARYTRQSAIYCSKHNLEPWQGGATSSGYATNKLNKSQAASSLNLAKMLLAGTGLISAELRYFYSLMDIYQEEKSNYLNKPTNENIFLKFLESGPEYAPKLIMFIGRLVARFYGKVTTGVVADDSEEAYYNVDFLLKTFLQNDIIYSVVSFFSKVIADCESIRDALYEKVAVDKEEDGVMAKNMISVLYVTSVLLHNLVLNKTFMDFEFSILSEKYMCLTALFKNICENNCQKFKLYLGTLAPALEGVPSLNKAKKSLVYDAYVKLEGAYSSFAIHTNKDPYLRVEDKPELLYFMSTWFKMVTETVNGPCLINQKQIYIYRTDNYTGTVRRMVDNVESNFYLHKNNVVDYIDGLLEGNDPDIVKHFASNFTFDIMFDLICNSIKRLFIYCSVHGKPQKYAALVAEAKKFKKAKMEEKLRKEQTFKAQLDKELEFYLQKPIEEGCVNKVESIDVKTKQEEKLTMAEEFMDTRIISQDIMDYVKVKDYKDIMDMYLKSDEFSKHIMLATVFKLNDFMNRFSSIVAGYKISLENVYNKMVDTYGDDVPIYIINKLGNYERKEDREFDEKIVIYMFLCKITSEIELLNPSTKQLVKIHFPLIPKTFFLTNITKKNFMYGYNTSALTMDMITNYNLLDIEMNYNVNMYRRHSMIYWLSSDETFYYAKFVLWCLGAALNIVLIIFYRRDAYHSYIIQEGMIAIYAISAVIIFLSLFSLMVWFSTRYKEKVLLAQANWTELSAIKVSKFRKNYHLYVKETIFKQLYPILFTFYILCCFLGIFIAPIFFTFMVLTIVTLSTTMDYVVKAITTHIDQLALTVILMIMTIYCYSVLSAEYFFDKLQSNQPGSTYSNCTQLWECLLFIFDYGLRAGGGIGESSIAVNPLNGGEGVYVGKFFWDIIFFFLINVISLNIIFGIIIDTFADMRQKNDERGKLM